MNKDKIMADVYKDFFGEDLYKLDEEKKSDEKEEKLVEEEIDIDSLFISDESKILLNKIINYMKLYSEKNETNYIPFNITIESDDLELINKITNIIKYYSKKYNYCLNSDIGNLSLYKLDKEEDINNIYSNGIVVLSNLDALNLKDVNFKKKFFYLFKENLNNKSITIISGLKEKIKEFLLNDEKLLNEYFIFNIIGSKPSVNDVYNELLNRIGNSDEEFNIKLLDYISNSYPKSNLDYSSYINNLYKYYTFNKELPKIEEVKSVDEVFKELNELVGLEKVKKTLYDLVDLITLKNKTKDDLKINNVNLHMVFLGNPGTGKTTVARLIGDILYDLKYIRLNKLIEVSSKDLVAEYVGQTAVKTMNVVEKAMGGILFIDEAYALADKDGDNSFNGEAIATLIKAMEDYRDDLIVIFAGYTKEMQAFLDSNSGIVSRIGYTLEFDDYTNEELIEIFRGMVKKAGFILEEDCIPEVERLINENRGMKNFGNARFIRNVFERTVINHATNVKNNKRRDILKTITRKDIKY